MPRPSLREKILTEGFSVVLEQGYCGATVRDIVRAAGVPQGSFTNHFESKEAFCLELLIRYFALVQANITKTLRNDSLKPLHRLRAWHQGSLCSAGDERSRAAVIELIPGVIDAAGRKIVVDNGYGPGFKYFTHRLGHGMGMDGHEWPYLVKNNMFGWEKALTLQPGMVFSDEPGIYIKGEFGVRLEDDMHITENGAELFTPQSPSIEEPFGS